MVAYRLLASQYYNDYKDFRNKQQIFWAFAINEEYIPVAVSLSKDITFEHLTKWWSWIIRIIA